jgi:hypothetical protein
MFITLPQSQADPNLQETDSAINEPNPNYGTPNPVFDEPNKRLVSLT